MSKGGAPKTQTVVEKSNSEPWAGAQPALKEALSGAQQLFSQGMPAFYPGSTVAPMSGDTMSGLNAIRNNASSTPALADMQLGAVSGAMNPSMLPGQFRVAQTAMGGNANPYAGYFAQQSSVQNPFLGSFTQTAAQPVTGAGMDTLTQAATGGMMQNPWLDATFDQGANQIRNQLDTAFARAGRSFGNSNYGDAFGRSLGEFATDLYGGAYESDMTRRMGAASQLAGYEQGGVDRMLGALGAEAGIYGDTRAQNLSAGQFGAGLFDQDLSRSIDSYLALANQRNTETGLGLDAAGMLPGIYDFSNQGARDLLGVGSSLEGYNQALIDADRERYQYDAFAPRTNVEWLNAIASGQGAMGGTSTTTGQQPYQASNPWLQGLGAAASIASIASMFGISDRALKRDAVFIGRDDAGNRIWQFRYAWDRPGTVRFGVMSDEVDPALVARHASGFDIVNYGEVFA